MNDQSLKVWEEAAHSPDSRPGVPDHRRQASTAAPEPPAARLTELLRERNLLRQYLGEACAAIRQRDRSLERWRGMTDTSFAGVPMAQIWVDLYAWESILNGNPQLRGIVELGTWQGGLSGWLWAQARLREMMFITFDAVRPTYPIRYTGFARCDVFRNPEAVEGAIHDFGEPLLLFCDGGNKPRELRTFAPMLKDPGSLVLVHDWGTETLPEHVPDILEPAYEAFLEGLGSITRAFRRRP